MIDYREGQIYKLVNDVDDEIYVGSTCNKLWSRISSHKTAAKTKVNQPVYKHLNSIGWASVKIILVESYACGSKIELLQRERYWIELLKPQLNKVLPISTRQEQSQKYYCNNKEKIAIRDKLYVQNNKEKVKQREAKYYQLNKDRILTQMKTKVTCDLCNCELRKADMPRHNKSAKHIANSEIYKHKVIPTK